MAVTAIMTLDPSAISPIFADTTLSDKS